MKRLTISSLILFITACSNRTGIPKEIIPPDSMQKIMKDIIMADQYSVQYLSRDTLRHDKRKANQDLLESVFEIHHITRAEFKNSLNFYESRPDLNKKVFDSLAVYTNLHRADLFKPKPLPKPLADTLK